jgi:hypothetical protein
MSSSSFESAFVIDQPHTFLAETVVQVFKGVHGAASVCWLLQWSCS